MIYTNPPLFLTGAPGTQHPAELFRRGLKSMRLHGGVVGLGDLAVGAHGGGGMFVDVAGGQAWIPGSSLATQGDYYVAVDSVTTLPIAGSDPTNPRIDLVVAQIHDSGYAGSTNEFDGPTVVTGDPAASPVAPATPASSIVLAQVHVSALASTILTGDITDKRYLATPGQPPLLAALPTNPYDLQVIDLQTAGMASANVPPWRLRYRAGSALTHKWEPLGSADAGAPFAGTEGIGHTLNVGDPAYQFPISVTVPVAGDYEVALEQQIRNATGGTGGSITAFSQIQVNGAAPAPTAIVELLSPSQPSSSLVGLGAFQSSQYFTDSNGNPLSAGDVLTVLSTLGSGPAGSSVLFNNTRIRLRAIHV